MAEFPNIPYLGPAVSRSGWYNKRYMVVHCTANDASPIQEAAYARRRTDGVGLHFASDPAMVVQVLESWYSTGHVGSTVGNRFGISWEFTGFLSSSPAYYRSCIDRAAPYMRQVMAKWGIPHRILNATQMRDGVSKGLVTHKMCSDVFGGSTHTDPGPNFDMQYLVNALNGAGTMTQPVDPWKHPTTRTQAQRVDALRGMTEQYPVHYTKEVFDPNDPSNVTETNELAVAVRDIQTVVHALQIGGITQDMLNQAVSTALTNFDWTPKIVAALQNADAQAALEVAAEAAEDR